MEREVTVTLEKAVEWYNSSNDSLKEIALQAFSEKELLYSYANTKSLANACEVLQLDYVGTIAIASNIALVSKASAAMFKLNIIRKALNLGQDLHLTKDPKDSYIYYPSNPFITKGSTYFDNELNSGEMEVIGKIKSNGECYNVLGGRAYCGNYEGLSSFYPYATVGFAFADVGFLGCASKEIALHFSKYFGMLITEAKYGDIVDFEIIESKY